MIEEEDIVSIPHDMHDGALLSPLTMLANDGLWVHAHLRWRPHLPVVGRGSNPARRLSNVGSAIVKLPAGVSITDGCFPAFGSVRYGLHRIFFCNKAIIKSQDDLTVPPPPWIEVCCCARVQLYTTLSNCSSRILCISERYIQCYDNWITKII